VGGWSSDAGMDKIVVAKAAPANAVVTTGSAFDLSVQFNAELSVVSLTAFPGRADSH
jgi:hypothetical protein